MLPKGPPNSTQNVKTLGRDNQEPTTSTGNDQSSLWDTVKSNVKTEFEVEFIRYEIGPDLIERNETLCREVISLREILHDLGIQNDSLREQNVRARDRDRETTTGDWQRLSFVRQVQSLLCNLGEEAYQILHDAGDTLHDYFHADKFAIVPFTIHPSNSHGEASTSIESVDTNEHRTIADTASLLFDEAEGLVQSLKSKLNTDEIGDVVPVLVKAFADEELTLCNAIQSLRRQIEEESERCAMLKCYSPPSNGDLKLLHGRLEEAARQKEMFKPITRSATVDLYLRPPSLNPEEVGSQKLAEKQTLQNSNMNGVPASGTTVTAQSHANGEATSHPAGTPTYKSRSKKRAQLHALCSASRFDEEIDSDDLKHFT